MKKQKKLLSLTIVIVLIVSTICAIPVSAAEKWPSTSKIQTYVLSNKNDTTVYETATSTKKYGTIYATDLITIKGYDKSKKRIKVTYPVSKGTKTGWIPLSAVSKSSWNSATSSYTASAKTTTYKRANTSSELGYISKGDKVYKIATSGDYTQVIYPISGGYKMGWIKNKNPEPTPKPSKEPDSNTWQYPIKGYKITQGFGHKTSSPPSKSRTHHSGLDITSSSDKTVYAPAAGTVKSTGYNSANGNYIVIKHSIGNKTVYSFYAHLKSKSIKVKNGQKVSKGTKLATYGNTGRSFGAHLHFAITDTYKNGSYYGYISSFSGNKKKYDGVTFYDPSYVIKYNKLP